MNKNFITMLLLALASMSAHSFAQNTEKSFFVEANVGVAKYIGNPALSLFVDNTDHYTTPLADIVFGRRLGNFVYALDWENTFGTTSQVLNKEGFMINNIGVLARGYTNLTEKIEVYAGIKFQYMIKTNGYTTAVEGLPDVDVRHSVSSSGIGTTFELGVEIKTWEKGYIGIHANIMPYATYFTDDKANYEGVLLPTNYNQTAPKYSIMICNGIFF